MSSFQEWIDADQNAYRDASKKLKSSGFKVAVYCGESALSLNSWRTYPLFRIITGGFSIGPVLFWDGQ